MSISKLFFLILITPSSWAVTLGESAETLQSAEQRVNHRFGAGLVAAGRTGVLGLDAEINITESLSAGFSIGSGIDYSAFAVRSRFYILAKYVNPFIGFGYAKWSTGQRIFRAGDIHPRTIVEDLMTPGQIESLSTGGFNLDLLTPEIGIQYLSPHHFAFTGTFIYLVNIAKLRAAPYGEIAFHWYF